MSIAIVSDSRLTYARFGERIFLKPGREHLTPTYIDLRTELKQGKLPICQFSFSGLKALDTHGSGEKDRKTFFDQLKTAYPGI